MEEEDAEAKGVCKAAVPSLSGVKDPFENLLKATDFRPSHKCTYAYNHKISMQF